MGLHDPVYVPFGHQRGKGIPLTDKVYVMLQALFDITRPWYSRLPKQLYHERIDQFATFPRTGQ